MKTVTFEVTATFTGQIAVPDDYEASTLETYLADDDQVWEDLRNCGLNSDVQITHERATKPSDGRNLWGAMNSAGDVVYYDESDLWQQHVNPPPKTEAELKLEEYDSMKRHKGLF